MEKTFIPDNFKIEESVRLFTEVRWGTLHMPDQFIGDFKTHFEGKKEDGDVKGKHINWNRALINWIYWSSPGQRLYNVRLWEHRLAEAKKFDYAIKPHFVSPIKTTPSVKPRSFDDTRERLRAMVNAEKKESRKREVDFMPDEIAEVQRQALISKEISFSDLEDKELFR